MTVALGFERSDDGNTILFVVFFLIYCHEESLIPIHFHSIRVSILNLRIVVTIKNSTKSQKMATINE